MHHVLKHPDPWTLASVLPAEGECPAGYEVMTAEDFTAWRAAELAAGWTPAPAAAFDPVPEAVTPWQLRKALNQIGLRAAVESAVSQADQDTRDGWEFATEFRRDNPMLNAMAIALGLNSGALDDLFRLAATL